MNAEISAVQDGKTSIKDILFDSEKKYVVKPLVVAVFNVLRKYTKTTSNEDLGMMMGIKSGNISISQMKNLNHSLRLKIEKLQNLSDNFGFTFEKLVNIIWDGMLYIDDVESGDDSRKENRQRFSIALQKKSNLLDGREFESKLNGKKAHFMKTGIIPEEWLGLISDPNEQIELLADYCGKPFVPKKKTETEKKGAGKRGRRKKIPLKGVDAIRAAKAAEKIEKTGVIEESSAAQGDLGRLNDLVTASSEMLAEKEGVANGTILQEAGLSQTKSLTGSQDFGVEVVEKNGQENSPDKNRTSLKEENNYVEPNDFVYMLCNACLAAGRTSLVSPEDSSNAFVGNLIRQLQEKFRVTLPKGKLVGESLSFILKDPEGNIIKKTVDISRILTVARGA